MIPNIPHEIHGIVESRTGPTPIGTQQSKKWQLYVNCPYLQKGVTVMQTLKAVTFSWADRVSKVTHVFKGDEVKFTFSISGKIFGDKMDKWGLPVCYNEIIIESKVEVLNMSQRQLFNTGEKDDLGVFDTNPKFKYKDSDAQLEADTSDLPF
jgi:hypothetical protein